MNKKLVSNTKKKYKLIQIKFDQAIIDFNTMYNSGVSGLATNNQIVITFIIYMNDISSSQANGYQFWVVSGLEYSGQNQFWIEATQFTYQASSCVSEAFLFVVAALLRFVLIQTLYSIDFDVFVIRFRRCPHLL